MAGQGGPEGESRRGPLAPVSQGPSHQLVGGAVQTGVDGRGGGPCPVSEEVAGVAVPSQGPWPQSPLLVVTFSERDYTTQN